ncbi:FAD-dependent oxidoreductase [Opitutaceae bacterium TAV3]|nr:FAD-dependent oxidoreductase [Opitutaceae bacterium TAV3]
MPSQEKPVTPTDVSNPKSPNTFADASSRPNPTSPSSAPTSLSPSTAKTTSSKPSPFSKPKALTPSKSLLRPTPTALTKATCSLSPTHLTASDANPVRPITNLTPATFFLKNPRETDAPGNPRSAALIASLNIRQFGNPQTILPGTTGKGDTLVQAANYRTPLSNDPQNRILPERPADYDPAHYAKLADYKSCVLSLPNDKTGWNRPQLVGLQTDYVTGDWARRRQILDAHWQATLGLLYYLQHDAPLPPDERAWWRELGLARDEFTDNQHRPYEFYVREARRLNGRATITQHDFHLVPNAPRGLDRAPLHADSIAVTDWYLDCHACTLDRVPGSMDEGKMMLHQETLPAQIPWPSLLPRDLDNLIVPVCLSATHIAWGGGGGGGSHAPRH